MERLICQTLRCKGNRSRQVSIQHNRAWDIHPVYVEFHITGSEGARRCDPSGPPDPESYLLPDEDDEE